MQKKVRKKEIIKKSFEIVIYAVVLLPKSVSLSCIKYICFETIFFSDMKFLW